MPRETPRIAPDVSGTAGLVRLLGAPARAIDGWRLRKVLAPEALADEPPRSLLGLAGDLHRVGPHVGDEPHGPLAAQVDSLVELLGQRHRLPGREPELAAGLLLERG